MARSIMGKDGLSMSPIGFVESGRGVGRNHINPATINRLLDKLPDTVIYQIVVEPKGKRYFTYVSSGAENLFGRTADAIIESGTPLYRLMVDEDRSRMKQTVREALESLSDFEYEGRLRTSNGRPKWIHFKSSPTRLANGLIVWDGIAEDTTNSRQNIEDLISSIDGTFFEIDLVDDLRLHLNFISEYVVKQLGYTVNRWYEDGDLWRSIIHPEDKKRITRALIEAVRKRKEGLDLQCRMIDSQGHVVWVRSLCRIFLVTKHFVRVRGILIDTSGQKKVEASLRKKEAALLRSKKKLQDLTGKLILTQEKERRRIARELHDDLSQQAAGLNILLGAIIRKLPVSSIEVRRDLEQLNEKLVGFSTRIQRISRDLHSAPLEHVGLPAAIRSLCKNFNNDRNLVIDLEIDDDVPVMRSDVTLGLYRVVQEAFNNITRHSGSKTAQISLCWKDRDIEMTISDQGCGFDHKQARGKGGLGLVSMEERVRMLGGSFRVRSSINDGTKIIVRIPIREVES